MYLLLQNYFFLQLLKMSLCFFLRSPPPEKRSHDYPLHFLINSISVSAAFKISATAICS